MTLLADNAIYRLLQTLGARKPQKAGRGYLIHAPHRPDANPSLSIFVGRNGGWLVKDHAENKTWTIRVYLRNVLGWTEERIREALGEESPEKPDSDSTRSRKHPKTRAPRTITLPRPEKDPSPLSEEKRKEVERVWKEGIERLRTKGSAYLQARGFGPEEALALGLGVDEDGGVLIPMRDPDGTFRNVLWRAPGKAEPRYRYLFSGQSTGYYMVGNIESPSMVVLVEGALNAASLALLGNREKVLYIGIPGSTQPPTQALVKKLLNLGVPVVLWFDPDGAGRKGRARWVETLFWAGINPHLILIPHEDRAHRDPNEILIGEKNPGKTIAELLHKGKPVSQRNGFVPLALMAMDQGARSLRGVETHWGFPHQKVVRMGRAPWGYSAWLAMQEALKEVAFWAKRILGIHLTEAFIRYLGWRATEDRVLWAYLQAIALSFLEEGPERQRLGQNLMARFYANGWPREGIERQGGMLKVRIKTVVALILARLGEEVKRFGTVIREVRKRAKERVKNQRTLFYTAYGPWLRAIQSPLAVLAPPPEPEGGG